MTMPLAKLLLPGIKGESAREFVSLLCIRDDQAILLRDTWYAEIVAQRERRERKKYSPTKNQSRTIESYSKDADQIVRDLAVGMIDESDEKKVGFLLYYEMEAFVSDEKFWSDLLSGPPRSALRHLQRFRLATIELIESYPHLDKSLADSKKTEFDLIKKEYQK